MGAEFDAQARDAEAEVEAEHEQLVAQVSGEGRLGAIAEGVYMLVIKCKLSHPGLLGLKQLWLIIKITISSVPDSEQERVSVIEDGVFHGIQRSDRHRDDGAQPK